MRRRRDLKPWITTGEIAVGKAEPQNGAAEAPGVGLLDREAGLERHPAQRSADRVGLYPDSASRQGDQMGRSGAAHLDRTDDRPICIDASRPVAAFEASIAEILAGNKTFGLLG